MHTKKVDKTFLLIVGLLVVSGFFLFVSASLGLLARDSGAQFEDVFTNQIFFGLFLGLTAMFITTQVHYKHFRKISLIVFLLGCLLSALVFVPGIGFGHGGAKRWINLRFITFQPSEFLKIGFVLYFAAWLAMAKEGVRTFKYGTLPFLFLLGIPALLLLLEPDTGTFGVIVAAGFGMFFIAGGKISHILLLIFIGAIVLAGLIFTKPYLKERVAIFLDPTHDVSGAGYQLNQSLLAIGSGQIFGRGFGQSIQKFNYLPEPTNDSIFAVTSEEFGFFGSTLLVLAFLFFAMRGFRIANHSPDPYSRFVVVGLVLLIITQSYINIASMLGLFPLTGVPLLFISHGGTALLFALAEAGMILNISRFQKGKE